MNSHYTVKLGLDRWATPDMTISRMRIANHKRSPYTFVFGAWIYCLKNRDVEAAEFLRLKLDEVRERDDEPTRT